VVLICTALGVAAASGVVAARRGAPEAGPEVPKSSVSAQAAPSGAQQSTPEPEPTGPTASVAPLAEENRAVLQSPLYKVGKIPASRCKEPTYRPTSIAKVKAYYAQFLGCLNKAWAPVMAEAGFKFWAPQLQVYSGEPKNQLCNLTSTAVYCNGVIYMNADYDLKNQRSYDGLWTRTTMAFLIAHEYGHHVQAMAGILQASHTREDRITDDDAQLVESRRRELQASCLSGVYLGADKRFFPARGAWLQKWLWTVRNRGDEWNPERTHGNKTNHSKWSRAGFDTANPSSCNTFSAKSGVVS
jgi:predicted metalloprotease